MIMYKSLRQDPIPTEPPIPTTQTTTLSGRYKFRNVRKEVHGRITFLHTFVQFG